MKMSNTLYTLKRWARHPEEDFVDWLPKYPIIEDVLFVWSLPEYVKVEWYWKDSVKEYLQLHGYNVAANADTSDLDDLVTHVKTAKLPLLTPKSMFSPIRDKQRRHVAKKARQTNKYHSQHKARSQKCTRNAQAPYAE